jgi:hypothetical protein
MYGSTATALVDVHSSFIHTVAYEPDRSALWIRFRDQRSGAAKGDWYRYHLVPAPMFDELRGHVEGARLLARIRQPKGSKRFSVGTFFSQRIEPFYRITRHAA